MLLTIEPDGPVPIYQQIRDRLVEAIADGGQTAGSALPSTRQLATDLGINFHTVNKSYDILRQEGLVRINRKSGAVVQRDAAGGPPDPGYVDAWAARLRTLLAEAVAQGVGAEEIVAHCRSTVAAFAGAGRTAPAGESTGGEGGGQR
ncbi:GntR family transcriptional regulator [Streptomyces sp. NPDC020917]|uniref:GntR family transcriptional regulator n=1 Tax=Streptomyces sp. NPDC020917 TaxID=3365102 RepID=UPI003787C4D1